MQIGLVCEGPTDIPAVEHFIGDQLRQQGLQPIFRNLFPELDRTRPEGGWSNLLLWLLKNPANSRVARYFAGGLFGGEAAREPLDAIVIQIDADALDDNGFLTFVRDRLDLNLGACDLPELRARAMTQVVRAAGGLSELTNADDQRHVVAVAVESTETWCVAAFHAQTTQFEQLRGADLTNAFMRSLERFEGRNPRDVYDDCDKNAQRREKFCNAFANQSARVDRGCPSFSSAVQALNAVIPRP